MPEPTWATTVMSLGPFLWAQFDETSGSVANDSSNNARHGSYQSAILNQPSIVPGHGGNAFSSSGPYSYVTFGSGSLNFPGRGSTYVLTYKGTNEVGRFFTTFASNTYLDLSDTVVMGINGQTPTLSPVYDPTALYDGNPHLIVYVVRDTTAELWVDGVMVTSGSHTAGAFTLPYVRPKQDDSGPAGTYDEFVLYSTPLTSTQIGSLWTAWSYTGLPLTRHYLPSAGTPASTPPFDSYWTQTSGATRRPLVTVKDGSAIDYGTTDGGAGSAKAQRVQAQYVLPITQATRFNGIAKLAALGFEDAISANAGLQCRIRVVDSTGATLVRLYDGDPSSTTDTAREFSLTPGSVRVMTMRLPDYTVTAPGCSLVVEIGVLQAYTGSFGTRIGRVALGAPSTSDQPATDGATDATLAPWIDIPMTPGSYASEVKADAPLAHYRLNDAAALGTMADSSGNGRNGSWGDQSTTGPSLLEGSSDLAAVMNGASGSPGVVPSASWMSPRTALTLEAWFKTTNSGLQAILGRSAAGGFGTSAAGTYRLYVNGGQLTFQVFDTTFNPIFTLTGGSGLANGVPHHAVGAWDGTTATLYVDGVQVATTAASGTMATENTLALNVGSMSGSFNFVGSIDEAAIYGTALSSTRVTAHRNAGVSAYTREVLADAPWGFWKNDETSGTTLADSSGNSRPMTTGVVSGSQPLLNQPGPLPGWPSVEYANGTENYASTSATLLPAAVTFETWVYIPSTAAAMGRMMLLGFTNAFDGTAFGSAILGLETGEILVMQDTAGGKLTSPVPLSRDQWYHVIGSIGPGGRKIRVNGVTVVSDGASATITGSAQPLWQRGNMNLVSTGSDYRSEAQVRMSRPAVYATQLSDARTDAHYAASMFIPMVPAALTGGHAFSAKALFGGVPDLSDPRDISGLIAWYSAESVGGATPDAQMSSWPDLSGNGNNATAEGTNKPIYRPTGGPAGGPSVEFSNVTPNGFRLPSGLTTGVTAGEIHSTVLTGASGDAHWVFNDVSAGGASQFYQGTADQYEAFGTSARKFLTSTGGVPQGRWMRYGVLSKAAEYATWEDNWRKYYLASGNVVMWPSAPAFGKGEGVGGTVVGFSGRFTTLVFYGRELTSAERMSLMNWMTDHPSGGIALVVPKVSGSFTGSGTFTATAVEVEKVSASLTGAGNFTATVVPVQSVTASLTGAGALTGTSYEALSAAGSMTGAGVFSAYVEGVLTVAADLVAGPGEFTATIATSTLAEVFADLTGSGSFAATSYPVFNVTADLSGSAAVTATSYGVHVTDGAMTGAGTFTATTVQVEVVSTAGALTGTGTFTAVRVEVPVESVTADLSGSGAFTAVTFTVASVTADLRGEGVFSPGGFVGKPIVRGYVRATTKSDRTMFTVDTLVGWIVLPDGTQQAMTQQQQVLVDSSETDTLVQQWQNGGETVVVSPVLP